MPIGTVAMKQNTSANKLVLVGHTEQDLSFTNTLCKTLEGYGWVTQKVRDSHEILRILEHDPTIAMLVVDEEMPRISGTCIVQRLPRLGAFMPTAVIANKRIPETRVPLAFRRPINAEAVARELCDNYQSIATTQALTRVAEHYKLQAATLAWVVGDDSATGKTLVRTLSDPITPVVISGSTVGKLTAGQFIQLSGAAGDGVERLAVKVVFTPTIAQASSVVKPAA